MLDQLKDRAPKRTYEVSIPQIAGGSEPYFSISPYVNHGGGV